VKIIWLLFFLLPLNLLAQVFPVDAASGKIYYAEEVLVKDGPQADLYNRAKHWFSTTGKNKKALKTDDAANGILIGSNYSLLEVYDGNKKQTLKLWYTVKLELADDRYWYSISDLRVQNTYITSKTAANLGQVKTEPLEALVLPEKEPNPKGKERQYNKSVETAAHKSILALIKDIKANML
jgi:hypothetical protein